MSRSTDTYLGEQRAVTAANAKYVALTAVEALRTSYLETARGTRDYYLSLVEKAVTAGAQASYMTEARIVLERLEGGEQRALGAGEVLISRVPDTWNYAKRKR